MNKIKIITHWSRFHADEVFASALLKYIFEIESIIRTRNDDVISKGIDEPNTIIIDVGRKYLPEKQAFDHHQPEFKETFSSEYNIYMSSCGLIWKHYGHSIVNKFLKENYTKNDLKVTKTIDSYTETHQVNTDDVYNDIYSNLILSIDANDNGVKQLKQPGVVKYNFEHDMKLCEIITLFNSSHTNDNKKQMKQFKLAMNFCIETFLNKIRSIVQKKIKYINYLSDFKKSFNQNNEHEFMYLDNDNNYYNLYINKFDPEKKIKFFISKRNPDEYRIYTRRKYKFGFESVAKILSESKCKNIVGDNLIFVHNDCFVGGCKTLEAAKIIVKASIKKYT